MNAKECITQRRSCRRYKDRPVGRAVIRQIVDLARFAPSWKNTQPARYVVIDDAALKNDIAQTCVRGLVFNTNTITRAAALAVVCYELGCSGRNPDGTLMTADGEKWEMFDAGLATQTFCLAAREYGVGSCIIGVMDEEEIAKKIGLPPTQKVACLVALGYPEQWKDGPPRLGCDELLSFR